MTHGQFSGGPGKQIAQHPTLRTIHRFPRGRKPMSTEPHATDQAKPCKGATHRTPRFQSERNNRGRLQVPPRMSKSHITTHVLPHGDVSAPRADHPPKRPMAISQMDSANRSTNTPHFARFQTTPRTYLRADRGEHRSHIKCVRACVRRPDLLVPCLCGQGMHTSLPHPS